MKKLIFCLVLPFWLMAQPPSDRYNAELFGVTESEGILFSSAVPQPNAGGGFYEWVTGYPLNVDEFDTSPVNLEMNIFQPTGDTLSQRPLVIIAFGGGFLSGSKDHWSIRLLCQDLAKRGYVTAAIDYRLGMNIFDSDLANRAVYRGLQDARSAVRFFRADAAGADIYKIDPDQIYLGGHSSGAFMALHNAYLDNESERPVSTFEWLQDGNVIEDQGCLDCVGNNQEFSGHANSVFSLAGAVGFTSFIESANDPSVVMFHSTDDGTVPYDSGEPFSSILWAVIGDDLPVVYGSNAIAQRAAEVGLAYQFFSYTNRGHSVHENGNSALYTDIVPGISDWFFDQELKPDDDVLDGLSTVCNSWLSQSYELQTGDAHYYDWQVEGGTFSSMSASETEAQVLWSENNNTYEISVTPYSKLDAKGDIIALSINLQNNAINTFLAQNTNWHDAANWSLLHTPIACEDVMLENSDVPVDISINADIHINTISIGDQISITNNATMLVHQKNPTVTTPPLTLLGTLVNNGTINTYRSQQNQVSVVAQNSTLINGGIMTLNK